MRANPANDKSGTWRLRRKSQAEARERFAVSKAFRWPPACRPNDAALERRLSCGVGESSCPRRAHNPKTVGANPTPATITIDGPDTEPSSLCKHDASGETEIQLSVFGRRICRSWTDRQRHERPAVSEAFHLSIKRGPMTCTPKAPVVLAHQKEELKQCELMGYKLAKVWILLGQQPSVIRDSVNMWSYITHLDGAIPQHRLIAFKPDLYVDLALERIGLGHPANARHYAVLAGCERALNEAGVRCSLSVSEQLSLDTSKSPAFV